MHYSAIPTSRKDTLHQRLLSSKRLGHKANGRGEIVESVIDNHQHWQDQVGRRLADLIEDQRSNERFNEEFAQSHSVNDRLMKLFG